MATKQTPKKETSTKTTVKKSTKKEVTPKTSVKKTTKKEVKQIAESDIRAKAQEIFNKRMLQGIPGDAESDWIQAEKELLK